MRKSVTGRTYAGLIATPQHFL